MKVEPGSKEAQDSDSQCSVQVEVWNSLTKIMQVLHYCSSGKIHPAQGIPKLKMVTRN